MIKIIKKSFHRNGISGMPFNVIIFKEGKKKMLAVTFEDRMFTAVFDKNLLDKDIIEFGQNSFRGDNYDTELKELIIE